MTALQLSKEHLRELKNNYMANAGLDENSRPTLTALSSADGTTIVAVWANPSTHRLLTDAGSGVTGPGSSTDNAVVRWDATTGAAIQNSVVIINDTGAVTGVTNLTATGFVDAASFKVAGVAGASGTFTTADAKTVTVVNGLITSIV